MQNTTYRYYNAEDVAKLFDLESADFMYSRLGSPTVNALEEKMAALEGGTAGIATSAGQAANLITMLNICEAGDHIIACGNIYGGTFNLFGVTLKKMGIETTFIDYNLSAEEIIALAKPNTKAIFGESLGNPALTVLDIEKFAEAAKTIGVPLVIDLGCTMSPMNAFRTFQGLDTLHLRMERHSENALALAEFLQKHPMVDWVKYPGLPGDDDYERAQKYLPKGASGVLAFGAKGGKAGGEEFLKNLKLASIVVHVGDIRTSVLHPASTTHRQLSEEAQLAGGIKPELIRVSVGCEDIEDIIADFDQALNALK